MNAPVFGFRLLMEPPLTLIASKAFTVKPSPSGSLAPVNKPRDPLPDMTEWSTDRLVRNTGDGNSWRRHTAQRLLVERADRAAVTPLSARVRDGESFQARLHALYALEGMNALTPTDVSHALDDTHYGVRLHALHLASDWLATDRFCSGWNRVM